MKRTVATLGRTAPLLRAGLIAGVIVAALAYPLAAIAGLGAKTGVALFDKLPDQLNVLPSAQTSYVYASDGKTPITMFYEEYRRPTRLATMSPYIRQAIVASEDSRFYQHNGVDVKGIARAFVANQEAGTVSQGASTLTMQYVRMALRDGARTPRQALAATEQTSARKLREMRLAIALEKQLSKDQILERYLNAAYFGHRAYGIYAAAQIFFSKKPSQLNLAEAATLAGLVKAPSAYDPASRDRTAATQRRNYVISRMQAMGTITAEQAAAAERAPIRLRLTNPPNDCISVSPEHNDWGFFCDYLKNWWMAQPAFGPTPAERLDRLRRGGYSIVTSINPTIQAAAEKHLLAKEGRHSRYALGEVVVQPRTGRVLAMAVNRTYSLDQSHNGENSDPNKRGKFRGNYPNTVNPLLGGGDMPGYQAGSTFKIFTMLAALSKGLPLSTSFYAPQHYRSKYLTGPGDPSACDYDHWCPHNDNASMTGRQSMWSGFGKSVNTYFVQLEQKVGAQNAVKMAERLGMSWRTGVDRDMASPAHASGWGAFTLGVSNATPLEIANVFATLAAEGKYCDPSPVKSIRRPNGHEATYKGVPVAEPRCRQALKPAVARAATDAARCVTGYGAARGGCGGWSTSPMIHAVMQRPVAGKSGTTDSERAAWFSGFTPQLAASAFIADPDNPKHIVGSGNSIKPKLTVAQTLRDALKGQPKLDFHPPPDWILH